MEAGVLVKLTLQNSCCVWTLQRQTESPKSGLAEIFQRSLNGAWSRREFVGMLPQRLCLGCRADLRAGEPTWMGLTFTIRVGWGQGSEMIRSVILNDYSLVRRWVGGGDGCQFSEQGTLFSVGHVVI